MYNSCFEFLEDDFPDIFSKCIKIEYYFINRKFEKGFKSSLELSEEVTKKVLEIEGLEKYNNLSQIERLKRFTTIKHKRHICYFLCIKIN